MPGEHADANIFEEYFYARGENLDRKTDKVMLAA
jgi:hypothetical protein